MGKLDKQYEEFKAYQESVRDLYQVNDQILIEMKRILDNFHKFGTIEKCIKLIPDIPFHIWEELFNKGYATVFTDPTYKALEPYLLFTGNRDYYLKLAPTLLDQVPLIEKYIAESPNNLVTTYNQYLKLRDEGNIAKQDEEIVARFKPSSRK